MTDRRFGRLFVKHRQQVAGRKVAWCCRCDCGNDTVVKGDQLRAGKTRSCGCLGLDRKTTHGRSHSSEYSIWENMRQRCENPNTPNYSRYGGRGITICERWRRFENFFADMGKRPTGTSLERINNDGPYEPGNCRWATTKEQALNRRNNRRVTFRGESLTIKEWSQKTGLAWTTLRSRLDKGWPVDVALTVPSTVQVRWGRL